MLPRIAFGEHPFNSIGIYFNQGDLPILYQAIDNENQLHGHEKRDHPPFQYINLY